MAKSPPPPPPPPPPSTSGGSALSLTVEFPDGRVVRTSVGHRECAGECAWYDIGGFVQAAFKKARLEVVERCTGKDERPDCHITGIDGVSNSKAGRWVMFRNGVRNAYPYNKIMHDSQFQQIVYRFIPSSKK